MNAGRDDAAKNEAESDGDGGNVAEKPLLERWARIGDDYVVNKLIGRGGQSQIYEGYDTRHERLVAIKVFLFKHQLNASMLKRAKAEAKAEMRFGHPNIVKVYAAGVSEIRGPDGRKRELFYSVMEFLEGETLEDRIYRKGRLDLREALWILAEAADGLAMLHAARIVHRDIKPENIFLAKPIPPDGETRVVLIDLGIAKLDPKEFSVQRTDANILLGTFAYMSPEQIHHRHSVDGRADLYALGIVAFKCLTGVHPAWNHHEHPNPPPAEEYAAWHMTVVPPLVSAIRPDVPERVAALVARLVAKERDDRYRDAETAALEAVADLRERIAELEATPPPVAPVPHRRWGGVAVASPSEVWRPMGEATTQEDEGNDGPTAARGMPVRMRGAAADAPGSSAPPASPAARDGAPREPEPVPPARAPLRTGAGTEILEVSGGFAPGALGAAGALPRALAPSAPAAAAPEVERTRTGTEIVPRERLAAALGLEATPLDLSKLAAEVPVLPPPLVTKAPGSGDPATHALPPPAPVTKAPASSDPATRVEGPPGPRGSSLPFRGAADVHREVADSRSALRPLGGVGGDAASAPSGAEQKGLSAASSAMEARATSGEARTTSGHLLTLAPRAPSVRSSRMAWAIAAFAGVLCGIVVLVLRSPHAPPSAGADAGPITIAMPTLDAGSPDAAGAIAETPDAEPPDAAAEGAPDAAAEDAQDGAAPAAGKTAPGSGKKSSSGGGAPNGQRVCDFTRRGCAPPADCEGELVDPVCNYGWATPAQRAWFEAHRDPPKAGASATTTAPPAPTVAPSPSPASTRPRLPSNMAPQPLPAHDRIRD